MDVTVLYERALFLVVWSCLDCHYYVVYAGLSRTFQESEQQALVEMKEDLKRDKADSGFL